MVNQLVLVADFQKHLRGCGEDKEQPVIAAFKRETPPHLWRRLLLYLFSCDMKRNTSAGAEKIHYKKG